MNTNDLSVAWVLIEEEDERKCQNLTWKKTRPMILILQSLFRNSV